MPLKQAAAHLTGGQELAGHSVDGPLNSQKAIHMVVHVNGQVSVSPTSVV